MRVRILGSGAGGGVPQWNCGCPNCRAGRSSHQRSAISVQPSARRTQSCIAVSADGKRWVLLNASPDLSSQFASFPPLAPPRGKLRGSPLEAVVLTDGEMDHVTGLLSLREGGGLHLVCTGTVRRLLEKDLPILPPLRHYLKIRHSSFPARIAGLRFRALDLSCKPPPYARRGARKGDVVGLRIESHGASLAYIPGLPAITGEVRKFVAGCDALLVDGTFWTDDEMVSLGLTKRTSRDMGHVAMSGPGGSLAWLAGLDVKRRLYLHVNNTNPVLRRGSSERRAVEHAGVGIAHDGMDFRL